MIGAADQYRQLMTELVLLRSEAGGPLKQMEEARFVGAMDRCWRVMSDEERDAVEVEFASDYVPAVNEEPEEINERVDYVHHPVRKENSRKTD